MPSAIASPSLICSSPITVFAAIRKADWAPNERTAGEAVLMTGKRPLLAPDHVSQASHSRSRHAHAMRDGRLSCQLPEKLVGFRGCGNAMPDLGLYDIPDLAALQVVDRETACLRCDCHMRGEEGWAASPAATHERPHLVTITVDLGGPGPVVVSHKGQANKKQPTNTTSRHVMFS